MTVERCFLTVLLLIKASLLKVLIHSPRRFLTLSFGTVIFQVISLSIFKWFSKIMFARYSALNSPIKVILLVFLRGRNY